MENRISVHISTMDRATEVTLLLQSLMNQTIKDFDIVIVDGSSTPLMNYHFFQRMVLMIKNRGHKIIYQRAFVNENCKSRNQCIQADNTNNSLICRIDDDCIISNNYLELLRNLIIEENAALSSGVTPTVTGSEFKRDASKLKMLNELKFDEEGNIVYLGDDCGVDYLDYKINIFPAHHLRSSFMYKKEIHDKANIFYKTPGRVAFREETEFCLRCAWAGYKNMLVDVRAKAYHFQAPSGGCRANDYQQQVFMGDERFRAWAKRTFKRLGNPFEVKE